MRLDLIAPKRLPRIRGDRPQVLEAKQVLEAATPHTRGSTAQCTHKGVKLWGYPAYAGIDLHAPARGATGGGLPRIRGDRPVVVGLLEFAVLATPHTRGSTPAPARACALHRGYPAYAGIDPTRCWIQDV